MTFADLRPSDISGGDSSASAMSWESLNSDFLSGGIVSHQLSATRLLDGLDDDNDDDDVAYAEVRPPTTIATPTSHPPPPEAGRRRHRPTSASSAQHCSAAFGCFRACRARLHQRLARRKVAAGVRLYAQHQHAAAVRKWRSALKAVRARDDRFRLLGYLYEAHMDCGAYRAAMGYAHRQLYVAEELDAARMRAESYAHLARAHARAGALERALAYARHSLCNECDGACASTAGRVHLTVAAVHLELAGFAKALDSLRTAHRIAHAAADSALQLDVYVGLSQLFARVRDADKSARYAAKAYDLSRALQLGDLNSRHHRAALVQMAAALRQQGELGDAHDYCAEATRLALAAGDRATYARSVRIMGDIYRKKRDINKAFRQYETAMGSAAAMGDRVVQMEAMDGAARCLEALRTQRKICNCRPLEFNTRLLEVAGSVGARLLVRTVRVRLARIYRALGDEEQRAHHERAAHRLLADLQMACAACGGAYGVDAADESVEALPCAHLVHARCAPAGGAAGRKQRVVACAECARARLDYAGGVGVGCAPLLDYSPMMALSACSSDSQQEAISSV